MASFGARCSINNIHICCSQLFHSGIVSFLNADEQYDRNNPLLHSERVLLIELLNELNARAVVGPPDPGRHRQRRAPNRLSLQTILSELLKARREIGIRWLPVLIRGSFFCLFLYTHDRERPNGYPPPGNCSSCGEDTLALVYPHETALRVWLKGGIEPLTVEDYEAAPAASSARIAQMMRDTTNRHCVAARRCTNCQVILLAGPLRLLHGEFPRTLRHFRLSRTDVAQIAGPCWKIFRWNP